MTNLLMFGIFHVSVEKTMEAKKFGKICQLVAQRFFDEQKIFR